MNENWAVLCSKVWSPRGSLREGSFQLSKVISNFLESINYATYNRIKPFKANYRLFTFLSNSLWLLGVNQYTRYHVSSGLEEDYNKTACALARVTERN